MQRTLYGALVQTWFLVVAGIGFMSIGQSGDNVPNVVGFVLILTGAFCAAGSYIIFVRRMQALTRNEPLTRWTTVVFNGIIIAMVFFSLMFELCYAIMYPYLSRSDAVSFDKPTDASNMTTSGWVNE